MSAPWEALFLNFKREARTHVGNAGRHEQASLAEGAAGPGRVAPQGGRASLLPARTVLPLPGGGPQGSGGGGEGATHLWLRPPGPGPSRIGAPERRRPRSRVPGARWGSPCSRADGEVGRIPCAPEAGEAGRRGGCGGWTGGAWGCGMEQERREEPRVCGSPCPARFKEPLARPRLSRPYDRPRLSSRLPAPSQAPAASLGCSRRIHTPAPPPPSRKLRNPAGADSPVIQSAVKRECPSATGGSRC